MRRSKLSHTVAAKSTTQGSLALWQSKYVIGEDGLDVLFALWPPSGTLWSWSLVVFVLFFVTVFTVFACCTFKQLAGVIAWYFFTENATSSAVYG